MIGLHQPQRKDGRAHDDGSTGNRDLRTVRHQRTLHFGGRGKEGLAGTELLKATTGDTVERATDTAQRLVGTTLESQLDRAADILASVADAVRRTGDELEEDEPRIAGFVGGAAGQVDRASIFLRGKRMDEVVRDAESFARSQPALFIGGAIALGALAARFLKASPSSSVSRSSRSGYGNASAGYGSTQGSSRQDFMEPRESHAYSRGDYGTQGRYSSAAGNGDRMFSPTRSTSGRMNGGSDDDGGA